MNEYRSCAEEASIILLGKLTTEIQMLEVDLQKQLAVKKLIDEVLYKYNITSKETALVVGDIEQKAQLYLACKKLEGCSPKTIKNYYGELMKFNNFFNKPVTTINSMDIRMYMSSFGNVKESTVNVKMTPIRDFFSWLQNEEYIVSNPTKKVKPVKEPHRERTPLNDEQVEKIRDGLNGTTIKEIREKALFEFLLATGCRVGEVANIKIKEIDFNRMSLLVIGKGNKQRRIYFNNRAKLAVLKYINSRKGKSEYLFASENAPYGKIGIRTIQAIIASIERRTNVGVHLYPHIFRHTFATKALNYMAIETVQALLGHSRLDTTLIYAKTNEENTEFMYRKIN